MRIAVTGPESSGKTTLAKTLSKTLQIPWIPEFARDYLIELNRPYHQDDLVKIAIGQLAEWNKFSSEASIVCDTEMLVMNVWSQVKYGSVDPFIKNAWAEQRFDHYFLCRPDIPWEEDPLREHPENRETLFEMYYQELKDKNLPFTIVEGDLENRIEICLREVKSGCE